MKETPENVSLTFKFQISSLNLIVFFLLLDIKETAQAVNKTMLDLVSSKSDMSQVFKHLDLDSIMEVLRQYLAHSSVDTKVAVLKWIHHLFTEAKDKVIISTIKMNRID